MVQSIRSWRGSRESTVWYDESDYGMYAAAIWTDKGWFFRLRFCFSFCLGGQGQPDSMAQGCVRRMHDTEIADLVKALRWNMLKKPPNKLLASQLNRPFVPSEDDVGICDFNDPVVRDRNSVDIARQIVDQIVETTVKRNHPDIPFLLPYSLWQLNSG